MALYLGNSQKLNIVLNGSCFRPIVSIKEQTITNTNKLLSSDGYILKDINGVYLMPTIESIKLLSSDNYLLKDSNEFYLISKESE